MLIGTAGHIDHGKTTLVRALTGVDTDRLQEEKARGITIDLGYAYLPLADGAVLGFVDVPGHERLIHNMLAGATGVDFVLLVVAADDGPMPQTREHLQILDLLGLDRGAVALTKADRVDRARLEQGREAVTDLLRGSGLAGSPIFPVSGTSGEGVPALRDHLEARARESPRRPASGGLRLAVDRSFTLSGVGTVITGMVHAGSVAVGDRVAVSPRGLEARVRGIHAQNRPAERGVAGERCALNLVGPGKEEVGRGDWVVAPHLHAPSARLDCRVRALADLGKALRHWMPVHVHLGALDVTGRLALLEADRLDPGERALAELVLDRPAAALHGDRFVLRDQSATRTLGGGMVLDPFPPVRGRRTARRLLALAALERPAPEAALRALLADAPDGADLARFALGWNLPPAVAEHLRAAPGVHPVGGAGGIRLFAQERWQALRLAVAEALGAEHRDRPDVLGPDAGRLRRQIAADLSPEAFEGLLTELLAEGRVCRRGAWWYLPGHEVSLALGEERLWGRIRPLLEAAPYQPPRVRDIARGLELEEGQVRGLLRHLVGRGDLFLVAQDHYLLRQAVYELAAVARELAEGEGEVRAAEFRDRIGTGRKLAIQILEFFDRVGFTRRVGDAHRLRRPGLLPGDAPA